MKYGKFREKMKYGKFIDAEDVLAFQLNFLAKGLDPNVEFNPAMQYIHIEPSDKGEGLLGVASDGGRLHIVDPLHKAAVEVFGLTTGFWQVFKSNSRKRVWVARLEDSQTEGLKFPNWRKVIPNEKPIYETTFEGFSFTGSNKNYNHLAKFITSFPEVTALNLEYLQALGAGFRWKVEWIGPSKPIKFTEGNRLAVIMPMQVS